MHFSKICAFSMQHTKVCVCLRYHFSVQSFHYKSDFITNLVVTQTFPCCSKTRKLFDAQNFIVNEVKNWVAAINHFLSQIFFCNFRKLSFQAGSRIFVKIGLLKGLFTRIYLECIEKLNKN